MPEVCRRVTSSRQITLIEFRWKEADNELDFLAKRQGIIEEWYIGPLSHYQGPEVVEEVREALYLAGAEL